jgi:hypothetical protein
METPRRWLLEMDGEILEAILCIVCHILDLLHLGHEDLVLVSVIMHDHQESLHHLELVPDESVVALDAELQGHLLRDSRFGRVDATGCVGPCYLCFTVFFLLGLRGIVVV